MTVCRCWAGRVSLCVCSSVIYPLSRLPAGQFLPTSRSSSLLSAGGVLWSAVGGNHSSSFLWSDSETARLDVSFYRIWSRARPASVAPRAPMNTLTRPHSDATSSLTDEPTNQSSLQWCWLKKSHCQIIWKLFFLWRQVFLLYRRKKKDTSCFQESNVL